jgi:hypothetical protein
MAPVSKDRCAECELTLVIMRVAFKDSGFVGDMVKTNAAPIIHQAGIGEVKSL